MLVLCLKITVMERPGNFVLVIFGATGDLTSRKLIPAIYSLSVQNMMPDKYMILGAGRTEMKSGEYRKKMREALEVTSEDILRDRGSIASFLRNIHYETFDYSSESDYKKLKKLLTTYSRKLDIDLNVIFYLATPPSVYETILTNLSMAGLSEGQGNSGVL